MAIRRGKLIATYIYILVNQLISQYLYGFLMARKGGNPDLKKYGFSPSGDEALNKMLAVKVTKSMYERVKSLPDPSGFMRQALQDALEKLEKSEGSIEQ
ncbi:MAG: hypothetical protein RM338_29280 [Nostoc sp. DedQUE12a]|nr:hypothetical protein [Nostoc sp. DedQUE12a]